MSTIGAGCPHALIRAAPELILFSAGAIGIFDIILTAHQAAPTGDGLEKEAALHARAHQCAAQFHEARLKKSAMGLCVDQSLQ
ncbi:MULTISPECIES: hypothetical protein [Bradyrhizobium]|uniref:Uncharacterized protein n=1 Tax=Bradyrhizobium brasilense TaxID=1419277 RepID=A0ABY8JJB0_9BRAD|nr:MULTISPECIES: hypothetical protein [Bradyrhizobium]WFU65477.1 hypothetical protein QA636_08140 [Bradyrhizobium brasilense]